MFLGFSMCRTSVQRSYESCRNPGRIITSQNLNEVNTQSIGTQNSKLLTAELPYIEYGSRRYLFNARLLFLLLPQTKTTLRNSEHADSSHCSDNRLDSDLDSHNMNAETFGRSLTWKAADCRYIPMTLVCKSNWRRGRPNSRRGC